MTTKLLLGNKPVPYKKVLEFLKQNGWRKIRQQGTSHEIWEAPCSQRMSIPKKRMGEHIGQPYLRNINNLTRGHVLSRARRDFKVYQDLEKEALESEIIQKVHLFVHGKKVLLIGNSHKSNSNVCDRLTQELGLSVDFESVDKKQKLAYAAERIKRDKYHFVIAQTSFLSHSAEDIVSKACQVSDVKYLRAGKARPLEVASVLMREFSLDLKNPPALPTEKKHLVKPDEKPKVVADIVKKPPPDKNSKEFQYEVLRSVDGLEEVHMLDILKDLRVDIPRDEEGKIEWSRLSGWGNAISQVLVELSFRKEERKVLGRAVRYWKKIEDSEYTPKRRELPALQVSKPKPQKLSLTKLKEKDQLLSALKKMTEGLDVLQSLDLIEKMGIEVTRKADGSPDWRKMMYLTKPIGHVLRQLGYYPSSKKVEGKWERLWIKKSPDDESKIISKAKSPKLSKKLRYEKIKKTYQEILQANPLLTQRELARLAGTHQSMISVILRRSYEENKTQRPTLNLLESTLPMLKEKFLREGGEVSLEKPAALRPTKQKSAFAVQQKALPEASHKLYIKSGEASLVLPSSMDEEDVDSLFSQLEALKVLLSAKAKAKKVS